MQSKRGYWNDNKKASNHKNVSDGFPTKFYKFCKDLQPITLNYLKKKQKEYFQIPSAMPVLFE